MNDCKSLNCSFCSYPKKAYLETISEKEEYLKRLYSNNKGDFLPFVAMDDPYNYRHKVIASFQMIKGKIQAGLYEEKSHRLIVNRGCRLQTGVANDIIESIVELANKFKMEAYNEDYKIGLLRHVQLRIGYRTNEVLVTLVLGDKIFKSRQNFIKALIKKHPNITSVVCNYNQRKTSVVLGNEELVSYGPGFIYDRIGDFKFKISSQSFYQVNPIQTEKLYAEALRLADIKEDDIVLDTYSGIGTLTLLASSKAKKVIGVEINKSAISDAKRNASINNVKNVEFILADASDFMQKYQKEVDVLLMDPTRNGSDDRFLSAALKLKPRKIVYISCGPSTQARDIKHLMKDYKITVIIGFDMFPFTEHVESVVLMSRKQE